jgi:hypothetical protein
MSDFHFKAFKVFQLFWFGVVFEDLGGLLEMMVQGGLVFRGEG